MIYITAGLLAIVLIYLQLNFLSLLNIIVIGLICGSLVAIDSNNMVKSIFIVTLTVVILVSFIFKIIYLIKSIQDFLNNVSESTKSYLSTTTYISREPSAEIPNSSGGEFEEIDLANALKKVKCDDVESFASQEEGPTKYVEGEEAASIMDMCARVCEGDKNCEVVVMANENGKNNKCKFYSTTKKSSEIKSALESLNQSTDQATATHYALIQK